MKNHIIESKYFDYSNPKIKSILPKIDPNYQELSQSAFAIKAYNYVRDYWLYNPNQISFVEEDWIASGIAPKKSGHCIDKAILYISLLRSQKIPARLGLAKVKNHIIVSDIITKFGNDVLVPHGYVEVYLHEKWVKATPAFNASLCHKLNVDVLEFDGVHDSLFQQYSKDGRVLFMEYLEDYGTFDDVPLAYMHKLMVETYPKLFENNFSLGQKLNLNQV